jgi:phosphatidylglycerophosphatase A
MDILKPPPARGIQRMPGGWGIVLDDLVAGVYALVIVQVGAALAFGAVG